VFFCLTHDPLNTVDIGVKSGAYHGQPLIQASQTNGSFAENFTQVDALPLTGYTQLDMYQDTLTQIYENQKYLENDEKYFAKNIIIE
jgi:hypothetical protein